MSNGFDISSFIPKFVDENRDRMQKLNQAVLSFEKQSSNPELLKEIMREVHTLKGTARMMGFSDIVTLSHKVEDVFVKVKEGTLPPDKEVYDAVFKALDMLANMVEGKLKEPKAIVDAGEMLGKLDSLSAVAATQDEKVESSQPLSAPIGAKIVEIPSAETPVSPRSRSERPFVPAEEGEHKEDADKAKTIQESKKTIRIGLDKIDVIYNHLVELIMAQMSFHQRCEDVIRLSRYAKQLLSVKTETDVDIDTQGSDGKRLRGIIKKYNELEKRLLEDIPRHAEAYESDVVKLDSITEGIRQQVMFMRMQPISAVFDMAGRIVRDISRQFNKDVNLTVSGADVELDNNIIEMLKDPFVHLLRNAVGHGIEEPGIRASSGKKETGTIALSAKQEGGDVLITIEDDGKGIDRELVKDVAIRKGLLSVEKAGDLTDEEIFGFIMKPGFSTSKIITDTSGRGVGMDVVKTVVDRLNGSLIIESNKGKGAKFILKVPATIALINVLIVRVGNMTLAIPSNSIENIAHVFWKDIKTLEGKASVFMGGQTIPFISMTDIFMLEKEEEKKGEGVPIILSRSEGKRVGFIVSELLCEKEIVFREFSGYLKRPRYFSGVTTLGTGEVVLILNMQELIKTRDLGKVLISTEVSRAVKSEVKRKAVLIAEDSIITAELEKNILINDGYEVDIAMDGMEAMDKLHSRKYDLLVTDIDMPRMNGFELTAKVRKDKRLKDMPIVVVTAKERDEDKRRGIEVGADAYILKKEFDQSNLLNTIKRLIGA